jgi:hypothetical protein
MKANIVLVSGYLKRLFLGTNNPYEHFSAVVWIKGNENPIKKVHEVLSAEIEDKEPSKLGLWRIIEINNFNGYKLEIIHSQNPPFKIGDMVKNKTNPQLNDCFVLSVWPSNAEQTWRMYLEKDRKRIDGAFDCKEFEFANIGTEESFLRQLRQKGILAFSCLPQA